MARTPRWHRRHLNLPDGPRRPDLTEADVEGLDALFQGLSDDDARGFASGDIFVRMITPGQAPIAQELGGDWTWNSTTKTCDTSVQMIISATPTILGTCTQVGYVADNPGYDANATTAPPLNKIIASKGPAC